MKPSSISTGVVFQIVHPWSKLIYHHSRMLNFSVLSWTGVTNAHVQRPPQSPRDCRIFISIRATNIFPDSQVKFNELSMDMYRIAQTLEREFNEDAGPYAGVGPGGERTVAPGGPPGGSGAHFNCSPAPSRAPFEKSYSLSSTKGCSGYPVVSGCQENGAPERHHFYRKENPHKHILYKPVFSHIINFISAGKCWHSL